MAASGKKNMFNEATRVQMPAMVHLTRLGYTYFGKITEDVAGTVYDPDTNILINVFKEQFARLNPTHAGEAEQTLKTIRQELDNDDIGRSFYERLSSVSPVRLVDFENPKNNTYHFTAEFTCKRDQDEFRPDITLFVNGLPLVFIEVKKPNNHGGMVAESKRMNQKRFPNKKFRRFLNITQLMIFSNNMEYDTMGGIVPVQGAFYCTTAKQSAPFNCFREENPTNLDIAPYNADFPYKDIDPIVEKKILTDFNCQVIHTSPEYQTNLDTYTPTNRVLTSMCSPERLLFILKYGIAYVRFHKEINGKIEFIEQKHIMRYQQMFAALTVRSKIDEGVNSGVIWHTQGSGKTALSYYLTYVLSDYFSKQNKVAKFYFIVDRLDLLKQASEEFEARGLVVKTASSRAELMEQFRNNQAQEGNTGKPEITVVNIQRFAEDKIIDDFKNNMTVDILIVFNMLLTGFDAPRLKRLYFGRKLKDHNLLQAITRVNRPYKENHYGYVIDFANIKRNFEETNEAYLKELNRFNDPNEVGAGNETDTFKQVIEDPAELIKQMQEVQQVLFNYTTDNAEEFSSEISTIEDKQELLKLKKILIAARDCCNLVRTFGDDELKETFAKMELTKLPSLISEVQHHIDNINQKELFASDDTTKLLVNEAMEDITFNFSKISEEELKIVGGKDAVTEKYKKTVRAFTQNIDPDDPEFITLQEAFLLRFKQHGFEPKSVSEIEEQGKELEDILKKLDELQKKNTVLLRKYNGDAKFARVHKRIREENLARKAANKQPIVSEYDMSIMNVLLSIKSDIDQKVYDRNDILKKDAYFERTVMTQIKAGIDKLGVASAREDRVFIQSRITKQYLDQYNQTYSVA